MQVWPASAVSPSFVRDLGDLFPQVLVIYNPYSLRWQAYEIPEGSDWDARRLANAIAAFHKVLDPSESDRWEWWRHPGSPRLFELMLPREPGGWFIQYLRETDHWSRGGAKKFLGELENRERERDAMVKKDRHNYNRGLADDIASRARDTFPAGISKTDAMKTIRRHEHRPEIIA